MRGEPWGEGGRDGGGPWTEAGWRQGTEGGRLLEGEIPPGGGGVGGRFMEEKKE